jgi:hypothetical protein
MAQIGRDAIFAKLNKTQVVVGFGPEGPSTVDVPFFNAPRDGKDWMAALAMADKMGRLALGMKDGAMAAPPGNPLEVLVQAIQRSKKQPE